MKFNCFSYKGPDAHAPFDTRANKARSCFCCGDELIVNQSAYLSRSVKGCVVCWSCFACCQQADTYNVILNDCNRYVSEEALRDYIHVWQEFEVLKEKLRGV